jgi:Zn-dependent peptidase ImmA (M78 family)
MSILLAHPKAVRYGVNRRVFTLEYAEAVCAEEGVRLRREATLFPGFYTVRRKKWPTIFLSTHTSPGEQLVILVHELAHHWLHTPETCFYQPDSIDKSEHEAETVSAYSLMPTFLVESKTLEEIHEEYGYPFEFMWFRKGLYEQFKR